MNKAHSILNFLIAISIGMQLFVPLGANAQNIISADPADTFDSEAIFINPAVVPFQQRQITLGMKIYQFGFLKSQDWGLRNGYFSLSLPETFSGLVNLGVTGQNFSVPLYDQTTFSLMLAKRPIERISLGVKYNLFAKSYHKGEFDLVDPNDPVFADGTLKLAHSIGAGIIIFPWSTLVIGFSCDHLNRPDVSLFHDKFRQPMVYDFGFRYSYTYFSSSVYLNYFQQHWQMNWVFEARPSGSSTVKLGFVQQAAKFAVQFDLFDRLSMIYTYDYPCYEVNQISRGSHQVGFRFALNRPLDGIKELQFTDYNKGNFPIFDLPARFIVEMQTDKLDIISNKVIRSMDAEISAAALKNLTEAELAFDDSMVNREQFYSHGYLPNQSLASLHSSAKYSPKYESWLANNLLTKKNNTLRLITDRNSVKRAQELRNLIVDRAPYSARDIEIKNVEYNPTARSVNPKTLNQLAKTETYTLEPEKVSFRIAAVKMGKYSGTWRLFITDYSDNVVKTFMGTGRAPEYISWNWCDDQGKLIQPDIYYYYFQWEEKNGKVQKTQPQMFSVTKISRNLIIDIRSQPQNSNDQNQIIEIKFVN